MSKQIFTEAICLSLAIFDFDVSLPQTYSTELSDILQRWQDASLKHIFIQTVVKFW